MKCLSVKQPWASLIASGRKTVELRTWRTIYRGPIIICASSKPRLDTQYEIGPLGVAICLVNLLDVRRFERGDCACIEPSERDLSWVLEIIRLLSPVPVKGQLSLWEPTAELLSALTLS
jgi:hypothetical protein